MTGNSFERNLKDGIQLNLPYLYSYDENITHIVIIDNNTIVHNTNLNLIVGGHFTKLNITRNTVQNNICKGNLSCSFLMILCFTYILKLYRWFNNDYWYGKIYAHLEEYI